MSGSRELASTVPLTRRLARALATSAPGSERLASERLVPERLEQAVIRWAGAGGDLSALGMALGEAGLPLPEAALRRVAWGMLGVTAPGAVPLGQAQDTRLTHLAELHDVTGPSAVEALGVQLTGEEHLAPDLLRARPWLEAGVFRGAGEVLEAVFRTEWSGFLLLLGEFGPWAYVPSVVDLQRLSRHYRDLVWTAAALPGEQALDAALRLQAGHLRSTPLLARLEAAAYRRVTPTPRLPAAAAAGVGSLVEREGAFWWAAQDLAERRRAEWAARRGRGPDGGG